jgi:hypothetical protein
MWGTVADTQTDRHRQSRLKEQQDNKTDKDLCKVAKQAKLWCPHVPSFLRCLAVDGLYGCSLPCGIRGTAAHANGTKSIATEADNRQTDATNKIERTTRTTMHADLSKV